MDCGSCQYFADFTDLQLGLRCMNKKNSPSEGDFMTLTGRNFSCSHFSAISLDKMFEWDEQKNATNQKKHGIGFDRASELLMDTYMLQMVENTEKWEDLSDLPDYVERNEGNIDPIRGKWIGIIDGNVFTAIYTFRGAIGEMRSRIISFRRADKHESKAYEESRKRREEK